MFNDQTKPVIDFYSSQQKLHRFDANRDIAVITADVEKHLDGLGIFPANWHCYLYPNQKIVTIILSVKAIQGTCIRSCLLESSQPLHMHLLAFNLRFQDGRKTPLPEEVMADHSEDLWMSLIRVPSIVQKFTSYIVLLLPNTDLGYKRVPFLCWHIEFFSEVYSILPNIFEQQLSHILGYVLCWDLSLSGFSLFGEELAVIGWA